jgi:hypothetical protein
MAHCRMVRGAWCGREPVRFISTLTHGILDYMTAPALLLLPGLLDWDQHARTVFTAAGAGLLAYSLFTRYELGVYKALPMKAHLTLDALSGAALAALPLVLGEETPVNAALCGIGLFEIAAALTTETEPPAGEPTGWFFQQAA